ncbi:MAG: copper amine oxidase N-terminal domain-containing protein [Candidatus Eremiobacteraeota bacterium]|nr:copper amine oxidase N-terminal domain-containing protein [Candidatus Eremiobacteraeota bacterium]
MKRLSTGVLVALLSASCGLTAVAAPSGSAQAQGNNGQSAIAQSSMGSMPAANFGTPPSGQIPILFNDHHVYSKPDVLKQGRVLAALVKGGTVLIPLRSMFEQMGASVSYDAASKTVSVSKPGSEVKVTVGKPEVMINGESRPLDVAPMMYQGTILVPVRVISEGMGAYVQWVPDKQVVVVRYMPATPPPSPAPAETPAAAASVAPTPTPAPVATPYKDAFIAGDYIFSPKIYNEFSPGNKGKSSYAVRGALEFNLFNLPWMVEGNYEQFQYPHNCAGVGDPQCRVTTIGQTGQTSVPAFSAREQDFDGRFGIKVADPRIYVGVGYLYRSTNYGYPKLNAFGYGVEKLPDLNQPFSLYGSAWYYPNAKGNFTDTGVTPNVGYRLAYNILKYQVGGTIAFGKSPVFIDLGYMGLNGKNKTNAPGDFSENGPFLGLGIKF